MRLLNPSPGEILDRMTILELKIDAAKKRGISSTHFEAERLSLDEVLRNYDNGLIEDCCGDEDQHDRKLKGIATCRNALAAINALLWRAEDEARETNENEAFRLAALCKRIITWNDARAKNVHELDKLYGLEAEPEKIYSKQKDAMVADFEMGVEP